MLRIIAILSLITLFSFSSFGQSQKKEFGLRLSNFSDFGIIYKKDKISHWTRWSTSLASVNTILGANPRGGINFGFNVGREKRKAVAEQLNFIHGGQFLFRTGYLTSENSNNSLSADIGFGYLIGMTWEINNKFSVSLETIPSLRVAILASNGNVNASINAGFSSNSAALVFVRRF